LVDLRGKPTLGGFTRLFPEHQDWHGGVESYYAAKLRLVELLDGRPLWFNGGDPLLRARLAGVPAARAVNAGTGLNAHDGALWRDGRQLMSATAWSLPGAHNLDNAALALALAEAAIGTVDEPGGALASFEALPHRLQPVPGPSRVGWINDSISTSPESTLAALKACGGRPVLIAGGLERGASWCAVVEWARAQGLSGLVALPDNGPRIAQEFEAAGAVDPGRLRCATTIEAAVEAAAALCPDGEIVLLSPGAPSFPQFSDFEERGSRFASAVAGASDQHHR
jgi:UDP-N-acetylmuramoylalanine--D-glutamate ligase